MSVHGHRRGPPRIHLPQLVSKARPLNEDQVAKLLGTPTSYELKRQELADQRAEFWAETERLAALAKERRMKGTPMTVSLYKSTASGSSEIVVQTNAQSLDVFVNGLAEALDDAVRVDPQQSRQVIAATLKNAFPVAFAIAGYKAEKVSESKLLTCGFASPDASELVAQSKV